ncbi:MAG: hypothetical protein IPP93_17550 [Chitinophagaceae bacterium]|nr:hypothetical protein [Chitinophagaceae bacterium]
MKKERIASIIFFIMPFAFAWVLVGQVIQARLTVDKLVKVRGIVGDTREIATNVRKKFFYTHKDLELRIYLKDTSDISGLWMFHVFADKSKAAIPQISISDRNGWFHLGLVTEMMFFN